MKIEELIDRYFEGQTSCEEERELRSFSRKKNVPESLQVYRPLFVCLDQEAKAFRQESAPVKAFLPPSLYFIQRENSSRNFISDRGIAGTQRYLHPTRKITSLSTASNTRINLVHEQAPCCFRDMRNYGR